MKLTSTDRIIMVVCIFGMITSLIKGNLVALAVFLIADILHAIHCTKKGKV